MELAWNSLDRWTRKLGTARENENRPSHHFQISGRLQTLQDFKFFGIFMVSSASSVSQASAAVIREGREAMSVLPGLRKEGKFVSPSQLKVILDFTQSYLAAPTTKAPPSKELLLEAVLSLLPKGSGSRANGARSNWPRCWSSGWSSPSACAPSLTRNTC